MIQQWLEYRAPCTESQGNALPPSVYQYVVVLCPCLPPSSRPLPHHHMGVLQLPECITLLCEGMQHWWEVVLLPFPLIFAFPDLSCIPFPFHLCFPCILMIFIIYLTFILPHGSLVVLLGGWDPLVFLYTQYQGKYRSKKRILYAYNLLHSYLVDIIQNK